MASRRQPSIPLPDASWIRPRRPQDIPLPPSIGHTFPDNNNPVQSSSSGAPISRDSAIHNSSSVSIDSQWIGPTPEPARLSSSYSNSRWTSNAATVVGSSSRLAGSSPRRIGTEADLTQYRAAPPPIGINRFRDDLYSISGPGDGPVAGPRPLAQPLHRVLAVDMQAVRAQRRAEAIARRRAEQLDYTKRVTHDRFRSWHAGYEAWASWDEWNRAHAIRRYRIPLRDGQWPGHTLGPRPGGLAGEAIRPRAGRRQRAVWAVRDRMNAEGRMVRRLRREAEAGREELAREVLGRMERRFVPAGFKFKRRLGMGGCGAVYLFEMVGEGGVRKSVVVKGSIVVDDREGMRDEKGNMVLMSGAEHFLQRVLLSSLPLPRRSRRRDLLSRFANLALNRRPAAPQGVPPGYTPQEIATILAARAHIDGSDSMLLLENMPRGSVYSLIQKLSRGGTRLSNWILWEIFHCLYRGALAMAFPTAYYDPRVQDAWREQMQVVEEWLPHWDDDRFWDDNRGDVDGVPHWPLVHFDLDPDNTLIGNFGEVGGDDHGIFPVIKVSDPGLSVVADDAQDQSEARLWSLRCRGKPEFFAPEQFSTEWDYEASRDLGALHEEETAGNFHFWTNTYQMGWIMWCLITHHLPPFPPQIQAYTHPDEVNVIDNPDGDPNMIRGWTYGWLMRDPGFGHVDPAMRNLIMRCLDHSSVDRPRLAWMGVVIDQNLRRPDLVAVESDEQVRAEAERIFGPD